MKTKTLRKEAFKELGRVRPDSKGRITLGKVARGVSSYGVRVFGDGRVQLDPYAEIPARERWLYKNPKALASVLRGLKESEEGKVHDLGSFARYANEPID